MSNSNPFQQRVEFLTQHSRIPYSSALRHDNAIPFPFISKLEQVEKNTEASLRSRVQHWSMRGEGHSVTGWPYTVGSKIPPSVAWKCSISYYLSYAKFQLPLNNVWLPASDLSILPCRLPREPSFQPASQWPRRLPRTCRTCPELVPELVVNYTTLAELVIIWNKVHNFLSN